MRRHRVKETCIFRMAPSTLGIIRLAREGEFLSIVKEIVNFRNNVVDDAGISLSYIVISRVMRCVVKLLKKQSEI